jgi:hypothetical protein
MRAERSILSRVSRSAAILVASLMCPMLLHGSAQAQEPAWWTQQKQACGLSPSLAYNTWASQGYPCRSSQPAQDPRVALHNRVAAVISENTEIVDSSVLQGANLWDDAAFGAVIASVHRDLWRAASGSDARSQNGQAVMAYYAPYLHAMETRASSLNAARADTVPQDVVDARDGAKAKADAAKQQLADIDQKTADETLGVTFSDSLWGTERNQALKTLHDRFPQERGLPQPTADNADSSADPQPPAGPFHEHWVGPEPMLLPVAEAQVGPAWSPQDLSLPQRVAAPEPPLSGTTEQQVSGLEQLATQARQAKAGADRTQAELNQMEDRYKSYFKIVHDGQDAIAGMYAQTRFYESEARWYADQQANAAIRLHNATWQRVYATVKAVVWEEVGEKLIPQALAAMAHANAADKARKVAALVKQVRGIEGDFELYSPQAARVLALGSSGDAQHLLDAVWGTSRKDGQQTMQKALDAAGAPENLGEAWRKLVETPQP